MRKLQKYVIKNFGSGKLFFIWLFVLLICLLTIDKFLIGNSSTDTTQNIDDTPKIYENHVLPKMNEEKIMDMPSCLSVNCDKDTYSYYIRSGSEKSGFPTICFNGHFIFDMQKLNGKRGINMAIINDKTLQVEDIQSFDTYLNDALLIDFLQLGILNNYIILLATMDDAQNGLSTKAKKLLMKYGSSQIFKMRFRDNFVMIGQRGLESKQAIEQLIARTATNNYPEAAEISGCLKVPVGQLSSFDYSNNVSMEIELGKGMINCGVKSQCSGNFFPIHLFTGKKGSDEIMAKMCINGKYIFGKNLNDAGRGLNVAVIDQNSQAIIHMGRFDTYSEDATNLEMLLDEVNEGNIIAVVSFDESSTQLTEGVIKQFEELGSRFIRKLSFRDAWVFVGQKGIGGSTPYEMIEYITDVWPKPIDVRYCVEKKIRPINVSNVNVNQYRIDFCEKYNLAEFFCKANERSLFIKPIENVNNNKLYTKLYDVPIYIISENIITTLKQLYKLFQNPGLKPEVIMIVCSSSTKDCPLLADAFNVTSLRFHSALNNEFFLNSFKKVWSLNRNKKYLIFLQDGVIPMKDFLSFFSKVFLFVQKDEAIAGVTAWNPYDDGTNSFFSVHRGELLPGLGFLMKNSFFTQNLVNQNNCCKKSSYIGWDEALNGKEFIIPENSRIIYLPKNNKHINYSVPDEKNNFNEINFNKYSLFDSAYESWLKKEILHSTKIIPNNFKSKCSIKHESKSFVIQYDQLSIKNYTNLIPFLKCFNFPHYSENLVRNVHKGLLRITNHGKVYYLIGSLSKYAKIIL